jgi:hypothetical protein
MPYVESVGTPDAIAELATYAKSPSGNTATPLGAVPAVTKDPGARAPVEGVMVNCETLLLPVFVTYRALGVKVSALLPELKSWPVIPKPMVLFWLVAASAPVELSSE